jgi:CHAD domain-containing protein
MSADEAARTLGERLELREGRAHRTARIYYDTFDARLVRSGLVVYHERGRLVLAAQDGQASASSPAASAPKRLLARDLEAGPLRAALEDLIDVRALLPVARIRTRDRPLDVLDGERKTVVRLCLQEPDGLHPRLQVTGVRGYDAKLRRVVRTVEGELGFQAARPLLEEAIVASGQSPDGVRTKVGVPIQPRQRADSAVAMVLTALHGVIEANLPGSIADVDTEFLHDLRVSVRRSRAVLRELPGVFPPDARAHFRAELRWVQQATGPARDMDVWVLEFDALSGLVPDQYRADLEPLRSVLEQHRERSRRAMKRALRSLRFTALLAEYGEFLERLVSLPNEDRPDADRPVGTVAGARIAKLYMRMVKAGKRLDEASPVEDYHELRKQGKELRYMLELFAAPLYPAEAVDPLVKALKDLQDVLGRHQDRQVQVEMLRSLGAEVGALPGGTAALMALGMLAERLEAEQQAARAAFAVRFDAFAAKRQRRLVRDTFRPAAS